MSSTAPLSRTAFAAGAVFLAAAWASAGTLEAPTFPIRPPAEPLVLTLSSPPVAAWGRTPRMRVIYYVAKDQTDRKIQQALLQPHKPGNREVLQRYHQQKKRQAVAGGVKTDYGTNDARTPRMLVNPKSLIKKTVVDVPKGKLGPKLHLDTR